MSLNDTHDTLHVSTLSKTIYVYVHICGLGTLDFLLGLEFDDYLIAFIFCDTNN